MDDYRGKWVAFFSHPADFTPVCTSEFVALVKRESEFAERDCALIGLSQQLAILRKAELVTTRREAKMVFYSLERAKIDQIADSLVKLVCAQPDLRDNRKQPIPGAANFARVMRD